MKRSQYYPRSFANGRPFAALLTVLIACFMLAVAPASLAQTAPAAAESAPVSSSWAALQPGSPFDTGREMTKQPSGAPPQLDNLLWTLGDWHVTQQNYRADGTKQDQIGVARWTLMNRGHGLMETLHLDSLDAKADPLGYDSMLFLTFNPGAETWVLGRADSWSESVEVFNGDSEGKEALLLYSVQRRLGGSLLTFRRVRLEKLRIGGFGMLLEQSNRPTGPWQRLMTRQYRKVEGAPAVSTDGAQPFGEPAGDRLAEAKQFDFLIGDWDAAQDLTFPGGQRAKFPSRTTAVYALQGRAVLEFNWFDVDPNLPDAAVSILRIYNRAMRRWESLYLSNRGNSLLHFGGRQEGDRMVLHQFATHTGDSPMARYVFHSIENDAYRWFSESSTDRGATFNTTWTIDVTRRKPAAAGE
ncbi:MAG: hypothetical protein AAF560_25145 [Acidobacteriota bacterium]